MKVREVININWSSFISTTLGAFVGGFITWLITINDRKIQFDYEICIKEIKELEKKKTALISVKNEMVRNIVRAMQIKKMMDKKDLKYLGDNQDLLYYENKSWEKYSTYLNEYELSKELNTELNLLYLQNSYERNLGETSLERIEEFIDNGEKCIEKLKDEIESTMKNIESKKETLKNQKISFFRRFLNKF